MLRSEQRVRTLRKQIILWPFSGVMQQPQSPHAAPRTQYATMKGVPEITDPRVLDNLPGRPMFGMVYEIFNRLLDPFGHPLGRFSIIQSYVFPGLLKVINCFQGPLKMHTLLSSPCFQVGRCLFMRYGSSCFSIGYTFFDCLDLPFLHCNKLLDRRG